jgi:hypothetical protein
LTKKFCGKWFSQCSQARILFSVGLPIVKPTSALTFDRVTAWHEKTIFYGIKMAPH